MQEQINNLNKMIEEAKKENDEVLVEYLEKAVEHLIEKQKQESNTSSIENNKEKESLESARIIGKGEVSTLYEKSDGSRTLESKYIGVRSNAKNHHLRTELNSTLISLSLDDINNGNTAETELSQILSQYNNDEDKKDITTFLDDVSKIGKVGLRTKQNITSIINNQQNTNANNSMNIYFDNEYDKLSKNKEFLDMEYEELNNKSLKDPEEFEELKNRYQALLNKLTKLYDETFNKIDSNKSIELLTIIELTKQEITRIEAFIKSINDLSKYADNAFGI